MKLMIGIFFLFSQFAALAAEVKVSKMKRDGELERSFVLITNFPDKIVLDCQSFIQGLRVGEDDAAFTYLLGEEECQRLLSRINASLRKKQRHCIDVDEDIRSDRSCF